jgi:hypothetical protein
MTGVESEAPYGQVAPAGVTSAGSVEHLSQMFMGGYHGSDQRRREMFSIKFMLGRRAALPPSSNHFVTP